MAFLAIENVTIKGIYASVPVNVYDNNDYEYISQEDRKKLIKLTGIAERRYADKGVTTSDLAVPAAKKLLQDLDWSPGSVDSLIFVSQLRDYILPCTAPILQHKLGLPKSCLSFDIPLGCSGFVYGLSVAASMMQQQNNKRCLLICGDVSFQSLSQRDKTTFPLFGDAATVTALEITADSSQQMYFSLNSDGEAYEVIITPDGGARNPTTKESLEYTEVDGNWRNRLQVRLDGLKLFTFTSNEVANDIRKLCSWSGIELRQIDRLVLHQANKLLNETIRKQLKLDPARVPYSLDRFGNTSSASIPLTIADQMSNFTEKDYCLGISGFGVGASWASAIITHFNPSYCDIIEFK